MKQGMQEQELVKELVLVLKNVRGAVEVRPILPVRFVPLTGGRT